MFKMVQGKIYTRRFNVRYVRGGSGEIYTRFKVRYICIFKTVQGEINSGWFKVRNSWSRFLVSYS